MARDIQEYRRFVDHLDLTEGQKDDLIKAAKAWAQSFVDRAFGQDSVQLALNERNRKCASETGPMLEFNRAADGSFGASGPHPEREEK